MPVRSKITRKLSIGGVRKGDHTPAKLNFQPMYVGIDQEFSPKCSFCIYLHDGNYGVDYYIEEIDTSDIKEKDPVQHRNQVVRMMEDMIVNWLTNLAKHNHYKFVLAGIAATSGNIPLNQIRGHVYLEKQTDSSGQLMSRLPSRLWSDLDILPFVLSPQGDSIDERACSAVRKALTYLGMTGVPRVDVGYRHEVEVDSNGKVHLCDLEDYQQTCSADSWKVFNQLIEQTKSKNLKLTFFNATPQGGGVALMRHAVIRFLRTCEIDVSWFVPKPKPDVFEVTKRKFHNVLQGVAPADTHLTDEDKKLYESWGTDNAKRYWIDGPFKTSHVIIVDDPQLACIIPIIKQTNPQCKVIYRSHIQVRGDLIQDPRTEQYHVWSYLYQFIEQADLFISHPVTEFVPECVPRTKLLMMPATTDPLDGLNKPLRREDLHYYWRQFNRQALDQVGKRVDFWNRPYIIQIARYDPSKGYPDVLKAYRLLRNQMDSEFPLSKVPQLVLAGHGSIDDPDGSLIFEEILKILEEEDFENIAHDIIPVRVGPSDQILNSILRGARVCLQLSIREGFEIKVSEAIHRSIPVIAYRSGGIPHQIRDGYNGFLVKTGDYQEVTRLLYRIFTDNEHYLQLRENARTGVNEEYFTVFQSINWLYLANELHDGKLDDKLTESSRKSLIQFGMAFENLDQHEDERAHDVHRRELAGEGYVWAKDLWRHQYLANLVTDRQ